MALFFNNQHLFIMFFILFLVQFSVMIINPFFALFMETIVTDPKTISTLTGLMFAITGLISAFSSVNIGKLNEKMSSKFLLTVSLLGTGFFFFTPSFRYQCHSINLIEGRFGFFLWRHNPNRQYNH